MDTNKKKIISLIIFSIIIILAIIILILINNQNNTNPEEILKQYFSYINEHKYEEMYNSIATKSKEIITQEDFIKRNKNIYEGIEANNITIEIKNTNKEKDFTKITYAIKMDTIAGEISFENNTNLVNEDKTFKIEWSSNDIFPNLEKDDKVRIKTNFAERGQILDRNNNMIAGKGVASSIGLVPGKMNEENSKDIQKISELLDISEESIKRSLNASYVKEDTFVPLKTVSKTEQELKNKLLEIKGIKIIDTKTRIYPYAEKTSHLIGYVQNINAEELEKLQKEGYNKNSIIGKSGIEKQYENTLRGIDGASIVIVDSKGNTKELLANKEQKDGQNIKLTIDIRLQEKLYDQFKEDKSAHVAINYKTGEVLALVSTPTYNSNDFSMGMTANKWNELLNDPNKPLYNRAYKTYAPGSSFKPVVGAIGVSTGKINPQEDFGKSGVSWQKDSSWGAYKITTLATYESPANLKNALINSDNIYFAKCAIKIGKDTLTSELKKLGFGENLKISDEVLKSTFGDNYIIESEIELADMGYGQGKLLVNPIHVASIYSSFLNEGNMLELYLEYKEDSNPTIWKKQVITKETAQLIKEDLIQVVESSNGTAHSVKIEGKTIGGKTGTAEIKLSKEDENGTEIGWFNSFNEEQSLLIISMVEDVKGRGGSHYLLPKIKAIYK